MAGLRVPVTLRLHNAELCPRACPGLPVLASVVALRSVVKVAGWLVPQTLMGRAGPEPGVKEKRIRLHPGSTFTSGPGGVLITSLAQLGPRTLSAVRDRDT